MREKLKKWQNNGEETDREEYKHKKRHAEREAASVERSIWEK